MTPTDLACASVGLLGLACVAWGLYDTDERQLARQLRRQQHRARRALRRSVARLAREDRRIWDKMVRRLREAKR